MIDMRLIDADALMELSRYEFWQDGSAITPIGEYILSKFRNLIRSMPTIEPERKKGHWIRHPEQRNIFNGKTIECSECHEKYTVQYVEDELFCRHCGADMRGEK